MESPVNSGSGLVDAAVELGAVVRVPVEAGSVTFRTAAEKELAVGEGHGNGKDQAQVLHFDLSGRVL